MQTTVVIKKFTIFLISGLFLSACQLFNEKVDISQQVNSTKTSKPQNVVKHITKKEKLPLPKLDLTGDILYDLLLGEIAGQRGNMQIAAKHYYDIALKSRDLRIIKRAVKIAMYGEEYLKAIATTKLWLEIEPKSVPAHTVLIRSLFQLGKNDQAIPYLLTLSNIITPKKQALIDIVKLLQNIDDIAVQLNIFSKIATKTSNASQTDIWMAYVQLFVLAKDFPNALRYVDKLLALTPESLDVVLLKVELLKKSGDKETALHVIEKAMKEHEKHLSLKKMYARLLLDLGFLDKSFEQFRQVEEKSQDVESTFALALLMLQKSQFKEAKHYLLKLINSGKGIDEAAFFLGQIAEADKQVEHAIRWYKLVKAGHYQFEAGLRIAILMARLGSVDTAIETLDTLHSNKAAQNLRVMQIKAEILRENEYFKEAYHLYTELLGQYPDNIDILYARAMIAEKLNDLAAVEHDLLIILKKQPDNSQTLNALGYILLEHSSRYEEAYQYISKALKLTPESPAVLDSMGWVLRYMGKLDEALGYLQKAYNLQNDAEIAAHLGEVLWLIGSRDKAKEVWKEAFALDPKEKTLQQVMQRFLK